jgi:hypothetical protein
VVLVETQKGVMKKIQVSFHVKLLFEIKEQWESERVEDSSKVCYHPR